MSELAATAPPALGMSVNELETPAAVVDLDRLERNIARVASYAAEHELGLIPHAKTHKSIAIARRQLDGGADGLTVAKSSEAEVFSALGAPLLVHYPVVGSAKLERIAAVASRVPLTLAIDSLAVAEPIALALRRRGLAAQVLIELDVGLRRTGVDPAGALELARGLEALGGGLVLAGLSSYPGHLRHDAAAISAGLERVRATLEEAMELMTGAGFPCERVSGGSTATVFESHRTPVTEIRPGNYALLDRLEARGGFSEDDCALRVHATVVSISVPGRFVLDAGSKALSEAGPPPAARGFGALVGHPELELDVLSEEHAHGRAPSGDHGLSVGDRVEVIPNHACTCVNLHDRLYGERGGELVEEIGVVARGALR